MTDSIERSSGATKALSSRTLAFCSSIVSWGMRCAGFDLQLEVSVKGEGPAEVLYLPPDLLEYHGLRAVAQRFVDPAREALELAHAETAGRDRGRTDPATARHRGRTGVVG